MAADHRLRVERDFKWLAIDQRSGDLVDRGEIRREIADEDDCVVRGEGVGGNRSGKGHVLSGQAAIRLLHIKVGLHDLVALLPGPSDVGRGRRSGGVLVPILVRVTDGVWRKREGAAAEHRAEVGSAPSASELPCSSILREVEHIHVSRPRVACVDLDGGIRAGGSGKGDRGGHAGRLQDSFHGFFRVGVG